MDDDNKLLHLRENSLPNLPDEIKVLIENGKNSSKILCERCKCIILRPNTATFAIKEFSLPIMKKKSADEPDTNCDLITECWKVENMYAFENIGFSYLVDTTKYLTCADCEIGPVGWHDVTAPNEFFIALSRVVHEQ
ncbi:hypothetical protein HELRODRAFT_81961 [Helobdella robusta]|uniref:Guanine nucleotide exchange factor MSS4 n=1 Tax=Helobdella robusta TaxID=6412 RepID=T1G4L0_HELRO|nr:hypothetical protein HELRODRAFT_81961 [Helobdella robusta]ESO01266.1 hypothetical protein HELRODRAFT_81961 [Helobdella robusta]